MMAPWVVTIPEAEDELNASLDIVEEVLKSEKKA